LVVAGQNSAPAQESQEGVEVLRVVLKPKLHKKNNVPPRRKSQGAGDQAVYSGDIIADGKRVGREDGFCFVSKDSIGECITTDRISGDEIVSAGTGNVNGRLFHEAIIGGTGKFANARGTVTTRYARNFGSATIEFRIIR